MSGDRRQHVRLLRRDAVVPPRGAAGPNRVGERPTDVTVSYSSWVRRDPLLGPRRSHRQLVPAGGDGSDHAAVDEQVCAGDERTVGAHEERGGAGDLVATSSGVPTRPAAEAWIMRWYASPAGELRSSVASGS
jgi:hypothetical protein